MKTSTQTDDRFERDARRYAGYLETPEGRLRLDLVLANLQEFLPPRSAGNDCCALDLGCGTGAAAVRLAHLGLHITALDSSPAMLEVAEHTALEAGVSGKISLQHGDAGHLASAFAGASFDLILCHNLLEFVDDPVSALCNAARLLRNSSAILSVLVRSQAGEVLKAAIQAGDLGQAEHALTAQWGQESLYGGKVRLFTPNNLRQMLTATGLRVVAERGVRTIVDYLPPRVSRTDEYQRIFELERKLGSRAEFAAAARYIHVLAMRTSE